MNGIRVSILALTLSISHAETIQSVRGNVETNNVNLGTSLVVVLEPSEPWGGGIESSVSADGSFELRDVTTGIHRLRLTTAIGETINEELVSVTSSRPLSIHLPTRKTAQPVAGLVTARRLLNPTPKKAIRAFTDAQKESEKGRPAEAARKLELAVSIDPEYFEAHCNLGVQYLRMGRRAEAVVQFEKAVALAPPTAPVFGNLAVAYLSIGKVEEARDFAQRTLELDKAHPSGHLVLGTLLARRVGPGFLANAQEAVSHLRLSATATPTVHMEIARIQDALGDRAGAVEELRLYLKSGDARYRAEAERLLSRN